MPDGSGVAGVAVQGDATAEPERIAVAFARVLRGAGLSVPVGSTIDFARALAAVGLTRPGRVYWAGRATLVTRPEDIAMYDRAFAAFFTGAWVELRTVLPPIEVVVALDADDEGDGSDDPAADTEAEVPVVAVRWSPTETLRNRDFAAYSPAEFAEARRLMSDLRLAAAFRRSRRLRSSNRVTSRPDLRRTVRAALRSGGEAIHRPSRDRGERPRRLVLLLDVSGSMEPYARAFVRFLHAAVTGRTRVEAFALGTRLTRVTRELAARDPDAAIAAAARRVVDWSGGTRIGDCLREFNDTWGVRGMARGATVVILSDGWDRGAPEALAEQMQRLARVAHSIVWVNPLKASPGYAPLAQGMAAALPYVDEFVEGHSLAALETVIAVVAAPRGRRQAFADSAHGGERR
ncbi:MAG TPA: VWA domain-containing protein [Acidimicrobiia bacterium]